VARWKAAGLRCHCWQHRRRKGSVVGFPPSTMASAEHEPITGVWRQIPQRGPGAEPRVRGSGGSLQRYNTVLLHSTFEPRTIRTNSHRSSVLLLLTFWELYTQGYKIVFTNKKKGLNNLAKAASNALLNPHAMGYQDPV